MGSGQKRRGFRAIQSIILTTAGCLLLVGALGLVLYNLYEDQLAGKSSLKILDEIDPGRNDSGSGSAAEEESEEQLVIRCDEEGEAVTGMIPENKVPLFIDFPSMEMPVKVIDGEEYIGYLTIPSIDRELPVTSTWSYPLLRIAPGRYTGSVYSHDIVICGHNYDRHFGEIKNLQEGAEVFFTDMAGNHFGYSVLEVEQLEPYDSEEMTSGDWDLTFFTCTLGGAHRVTVRCKLEYIIYSPGDSEITEESETESGI